MSATGAAGPPPPAAAAAGAGPSGSAPPVQDALPAARPAPAPRGRPGRAAQLDAKAAAAAERLAPHAAWLDAVEPARVFRPSPEEWADPLRYLRSIQAEGARCGVAVIEPPAAATPAVPPALALAAAGGLRFTARQQVLRDERRAAWGESKIWETQKLVTLREFARGADEFAARRFHGLAMGLPRRTLEAEYWAERAFWSDDHPNAGTCVSYGNDVEGSAFHPACPLGGGGWALGALPRLPGSALARCAAPVPGVSAPMLYVGMLFSTFAWHVEDHWLYSINYAHGGAPKVWYGVPASAADEFEEVVRRRVYHRACAADAAAGRADEAGCRAAVQRELAEKNTMFSPRLLLDAGVPVYRAVQAAGSFVVTFPRAYHAGFSLGFNLGEAVNLSLGDWWPYAEASRRLYAAAARPAIVAHEQLLADEGLGLAARLAAGRGDAGAAARFLGAVAQHAPAAPAPAAQAARRRAPRGGGGAGGGDSDFEMDDAEAEVVRPPKRRRAPPPAELPAPAPAGAEPAGDGAQDEEEPPGQSSRQQQLDVQQVVQQVLHEVVDAAAATDEQEVKQVLQEVVDAAAAEADEAMLDAAPELQQQPLEPPLIEQPPQHPPASAPAVDPAPALDLAALEPLRPEAMTAADRALATAFVHTMRRLHAARAALQSRGAAAVAACAPGAAPQGASLHCARCKQSVYVASAVPRPAGARAQWQHECLDCAAAAVAAAAPAAGAPLPRVFVKPLWPVLLAAAAALEAALAAAPAADDADALPAAGVPAPWPPVLGQYEWAQLAAPAPAEELLPPLLGPGCAAAAPPPAAAAPPPAAAAAKPPRVTAPARAAATDSNGGAAPAPAPATVPRKPAAKRRRSGGAGGAEDAVLTLPCGERVLAATPLAAALWPGKPGSTRLVEAKMPEGFAPLPHEIVAPPHPGAAPRRVHVLGRAAAEALRTALLRDGNAAALDAAAAAAWPDWAGGAGAAAPAPFTGAAAATVRSPSVALFRPPVRKPAAAAVALAAVAAVAAAAPPAAPATVAAAPAAATPVAAAAAAEAPSAAPGRKPPPGKGLTDEVWARDLLQKRKPANKPSNPAPALAARCAPAALYRLRRLDPECVTAAAAHEAAGCAPAAAGGDATLAWLARGYVRLVGTGLVRPNGPELEAALPTRAYVANFARGGRGRSRSGRGGSDDDGAGDDDAGDCGAELHFLLSAEQCVRLADGGLEGKARDCLLAFAKECWPGAVEEHSWPKEEEEEGDEGAPAGRSASPKTRPSPTARDRRAPPDKGEAPAAAAAAAQRRSPRRSAQQASPPAEDEAPAASPVSPAAAGQRRSPRGAAQQAPPPAEEEAHRGRSAPPARQRSRARGGAAPALPPVAQEELRAPAAHPASPAAPRRSPRAPDLQAPPAAKDVAAAAPRQGRHGEVGSPPSPSPSAGRSPRPKDGPCQHCEAITSPGGWRHGPDKKRRVICNACHSRWHKTGELTPAGPRGGPKKLRGGGPPPPVVDDEKGLDEVLDDFPPLVPLDAPSPAAAAAGSTPPRPMQQAQQPEPMEEDEAPPRKQQQRARRRSR